ncbi:hypothetical protein IWX81_002477 [Salinibacterium sp. CAN_S4]|uniref:hypothetical protein n=1 Tax=Salinibacterium sp. CAN_S4 TaxID=2787727 RepID=UPI0018F01A87
MDVDAQERPLLKRKLVGLHRENFDFDAQLAAKFRLERQVDVEVHVVDSCAKLSPLMVKPSDFGDGCPPVASCSITCSQ